MPAPKGVNEDAGAAVVNGRVICGVQPVREAIRAHGGALGRVLIEYDGDRASPQLDALARYAHDRGANVERAKRAELDRISRGVRHQGAIAFARELSMVSLSDVATQGGALVVALDEVQDPQNFGAIIRSAVAMGASAVLWPEHRSAPLSPATFRASAGAIEHATLCRVPSLPQALGDLRARGLFVAGLDVAAEGTLERVDLARAVALVVGAEDKGLRRTVKRECDVLARLPMTGRLGSLNASAATAIALYEVLRQRTAGETRP